MQSQVGRERLVQFYKATREKTEVLCKPLEIEDYVIQSIEDVSPPKWHLAHTTWFFETFLLVPYLKDYQLFHPLFHHLFNSYYQSLGTPYPRIQRGILSRPTVKTIYHYRQYVDERLIDVLLQLPNDLLAVIAPLLTLGLHHEQQHQELLLMDIKHNLFQGYEFPAYAPNNRNSKNKSPNLQFDCMKGGIVEIGHCGNAFCYDNELPRHELILRPYLIANRLVTNAEYLEFMNAGGYQNPTWWLADGWECVMKHQWRAPLYWQCMDGEWFIYTLNGLQAFNSDEPVAHISFYEADAYARFRGLRLPTESEWERYVESKEISASSGHFLEENLFHPKIAQTTHLLPQQFFGDLWEWTKSPYCAYPGYKQSTGALGEYNGKFMNNQLVLRGGSCITPASHIRISYRNFFQPDKRWQFSGIRLAADEGTDV